MRIGLRTLDPLSPHAQLPGLVHEEEQIPAVRVNQRIIDDVEVHVHKSQTERNDNANALSNDQKTDLNNTLRDILNSPGYDSSDSAITVLSIPNSEQCGISIDPLHAGASTDSSLVRSVSIFPHETTPPIFVVSTPFFTRILHQIGNTFLTCIGNSKKNKIQKDSSDEEDSEEIMDYYYTKKGAIPAKNEIDNASIYTLRSGVSSWSLSSVDIKSFENQAQAKNNAFGGDVSCKALSICTQDSSDTLDSREEPPRKTGRFRKLCRRVSRFFHNIK